MNPAAHASGDRIYPAVKRKVLEGAWRPGERIEAARLAETLNSSLTPVRAALQRLVGERLVEARPTEGFHRPPVTEVGLKDLYDWNGRIVVLAAQLAWPPPSGQIADIPELSGVTPGAAAAAVFAALARRSASTSCALTVEGLNDQLHAARRLEPLALDGLEAEITELARLLGEPDGGGFRQAATAYHRRRVRATPALVELLYRPAP